MTATVILMILSYLVFQIIATIAILYNDYYYYEPGENGMFFKTKREVLYSAFIPMYIAIKAYKSIRPFDDFINYFNRLKDK